MMEHNQFLKPGHYKHTGSNIDVVVTNVVTHAYAHGEIKPVEPLVIYRDLLQVGTNHTGYMMPLADFKEKFYQL
jgi:hypothetical protein